MADERTLVTGWGRTAPSAATVRRVVRRADVPRLLRSAPPRGVVARGLGRSYGDAAQTAGGDVLDLSTLTDVLAFDIRRGTLHAEAGLSLDRAIRMVLPFGWFVPVTPGTRHVTLGGALAADIHGKNHHVDGSFATYVDGFTLVTPDGDERWITTDDDHELFWATAGGMGLTGVITTVQLRLRAVGTSRMRVDTERASDLDDVMDRLCRVDDRAAYSVAWIDCLATGRRRGRGVVSSGRHATPDELPAAARRDPLGFAPASRLTTPDVFPSGLLNRATVAAFNELWFRKAPRCRQGEIQKLERFFHPLDGVTAWNRIYGPRGFLQYQFVVPSEASGSLLRIVERISTSSLAPFLAVLKRFGPANDGMLSFPTEGWTLALDFPNASGLRDLLDELDELVVEAGGRHYLAKDARMSADVLRATYPRLDDFLTVRARVDPGGRLRSDLARRLEL